ncbi:MAG: ABC transporter substrate-binding protein [Thermodesulfovibrionia bacterium]|nr:ABC transporter substrate-binding protein [Thermodesulfovibrionia bacterium]
MKKIRNQTGYSIILIICFVTIITIVFISCNNGSTNKNVDIVSVRLKWFHQAQFAGLYIAEDMGFYRAEGLNVELRPGGQDFSAVKLVAAGSEDFGIAGADEILIAREKGMPLVAIAVIFQKSPVCFFSKKDSGIKSPYDFVGRRVAMQYGTNVRNEYVAMMRKLGVDMSKVIEVPSRFDMQQFFEGKVDVWNGYVINERLAAEEHGFNVNLICPSEYGIDMYSDTLFTTEKMIMNRPDVVRKMVKATIEGWKSALADREYTVKAVLKRDSRLNAEHERRMLDAEADLIAAREVNQHRIGWMDKQVWESMQLTLASIGILRNNSFDVRDVYTNVFLSH